ncbi:uncharacterized protein LOC126595366 [Malus sylvestris]|uniref:uncharacterized protein LOC126595366 n=1 Tax=Malus sylvestris TaxID=3752 RepID=UPI0021AD2CE0|nr:uncharacterized protein LOC126595366 [Malus sylvestris]
MVAFPDADLGWLQPSDPSTSSSATGIPIFIVSLLFVENVKALLEVETRVLLQQQQLLYNGMEMRNSEMLSALGVNDEDLIMIVSNVASRSVDCGSLVGRVPKLILQIKGFTDATNRKRLIEPLTV